MERILMQVCVGSIGVFGLLAVFCAAVWFWTKARRWSVLALPRVRLVVLVGGAIVATFAAQKGGIPDKPDDPSDKPSPKLVFWSTLDSVEAVTNPKVGQSGTCSDATFVEGKNGSALRIPADAASAVARLPLPDGLPAASGCIEFWAKIDGGSATYYGGGGSPDFLLARTADNDSTFISLAFTANDGAARGGLCCGYGFYGLEMFSEEVAFAKPYSDYLTQEAVFDWHHYALVWNVDGITSLSGSPRAAIILDGTMRVCTNGNNGWNRDDFLAAMSKSAYLSFGHAGSHVPYLIDELKVWDAAKTTFVEMPTNLILYCTFDSAAAVTTPAVGENGTCSDVTFVEGRIGSALSVPKLSDVASFSFSTGLPVKRGCIEFWAKMENVEATYGPAGGSWPVFVRMNRNSDGSQFFSYEFLANSGAGAGGLCVGAGDLRLTPELPSWTKPYSTYMQGDVNGWHHYAYVWNVEGISSLEGMPGSAILVDGVTVAQKNLEAGWNKEEFATIMGQPATMHFANEGNNNVAFLIDELKVWDADKTTFNDEPAVPPDDTPPNLMLYSTLDSRDSITSPVVGNAGACDGVTFIEGRSGNALSVPSHADLVEFPFPDGLSANKGCIEFWAKLTGSNTTYTDSGNPSFVHVISSVDSSMPFSLEFNANNGGGRGGICTIGQLGFAPEGWSYSKPYSTYLTGSISDWYHYALVWNLNGIATLNGAPYAAILINGNVVARLNANESWSKDDFVRAMSGSLHVLIGSGSSKVPFAIDDLKIWDGDKTSFSFPKFAYHSDVTAVYDGQEHTLQPPAGLAGDEVFRYSLDRNGPFAETLPSLTDAGTMLIWYEETIGEEKIVSSATVTVEKRPLAFTSASATKPYDGKPLTAPTVATTGLLPMGEGFSFAVTGAQTVIGESPNAFTWTANEGTKAGNYNVTAVFGTLKVVLDGDTGDVGYELVADASGGQTIRITRLSCPDGGDVTLPVSLGGIPVGEVASGALAGTHVTSVRVPAGMTVAGTLFENLSQLTNATLEAGSTVSGTLSFSGSAALREVIVSADVSALAPHAFLGCWDLARVVFAGEPPFGNALEGAAGEAALLVASVRPATLLQMADMICYPVDCATKWEKSLRNLGYGGRYGAYAPPWTGESSLVAGTGNLNPSSVVSMVVTNLMVSVVTNILVQASPAEEPSAVYRAQAGVTSGAILAGAAGWDAFGLPDGMTWDRATGTLGGVPTRSGLYDVMLVSGSGSQTKLMRTTVEVAGYATKTGYVGVAFSASGVPWNNLTSYKSSPAGLKWNKKVLSGVPTKAGTYAYKTSAGEPVKIVILSLPSGVVGSYGGTMAAANGSRYPLTVSTTAAGKLTAKVTKCTKTYSLSATKWKAMAIEEVDGVPHRIFSATLTASGLSLAVKVDADAAWNADALTANGTLGAIKGLEGTAQRNAYTSNGAAKEAVAALAGTYALTVASDGAAGWMLQPTGPGVKGQCTVVLKTTGVATLSGKLPNKTSVNTTATLHIDETGLATLRFYVKGVWLVWENL